MTSPTAAVRAGALRFVLDVLPRGGTDVVVQGCEAALSDGLRRAGHHVVARALGVGAVVYSGHAPTRRNLADAHAALRPGGLLVIDCVTDGDVDVASAMWFFDMVAMLDEQGAIPERRLPVRRGPEPVGPVAIWRALYGSRPGPVAAADVADASRSAFGPVRIERVPGLHRFLADHLERTERGATVLPGLVALERSMVAARHVAPVGLRLVARR